MTSLVFYRAHIAHEQTGFNEWAELTIEKIRKFESSNFAWKLKYIRSMLDAFSSYLFI